MKVIVATSVIGWLTTSLARGIPRSIYVLYMLENILTGRMMNTLHHNTATWWKLNYAMRGRSGDTLTVMQALDGLNDILDTTGSQRLLAKKAEKMKSDIVIGPKKKGKNKL